MLGFPPRRRAMIDGCSEVDEGDVFSVGVAWVCGWFEEELLGEALANSEGIVPVFAVRSGLGSFGTGWLNAPPSDWLGGGRKHREGGFGGLLFVVLELGMIGGGGVCFLDSWDRLYCAEEIVELLCSLAGEYGVNRLHYWNYLCYNKS